MNFAYTWKDTLAAAHKAGWRLEDVLPEGSRLDFSRPFLPESLARTRDLDFLSASERTLLNQIRGHAYLCVFGLVEEFILPFVLDHARPELGADDWRTRALLQFAGEEAKHIHLFKRFRERFEDGFGARCEVIGPPEAIAKAVLAHSPLAVALTILHIEWMTQAHWLQGVKDDQELDPLFKSLLRHHWMEEAQHARLDTLMVQALAAGLDQDQIRAAVDEYLQIGGMLDAGLSQQTLLDLAALERAGGRTLPAAERERFLEVQLQANRWTYLGSGMTHPNFQHTLGELGPEHRERVLQAAGGLC
ncbi:MAG: hypothetical protein EYC70_15360 [Planctomycetota bacterium]|nr:MAG: hypothetical protein EYC70_15360 [Planctomycetota bacterium]